MRKRITFLAAILPLLFASHAFAGAWTQKKGGYYLKLAGGYLNTTQDINAAGDKVDKDGEGRLRDVNCTAYIEYGISDELTLVATAPYKNMKDTRTFQTGTALERRWGFGDVEVRMRRLLWNRDFVASVAAGGKIPTWYEDDENTRRAVEHEEDRRRRAPPDRKIPLPLSRGISRVKRAIGCAGGRSATSGSTRWRPA